MTTTTSFFDKRRFVGLYKSTFRRNIGYFGLLSALLVIFYPMQYAMEAFKRLDPLTSSPTPLADPFYHYHFGGLGMNFTGVSGIFFTGIVLLAPMVLALLLGSYMQSKKAADVYHALPVKRELLLLVNGAVAMSFIAIPVVGSTVLIALMQIAKFGVQPALLGLMFLDLFGWLVAAFCVYTVTAFVSVLVGTVFDNVVLAGSLLVAPPAIYGLFMVLAQLYLYGFTGARLLLNFLLNLSPLTMMPARFLFDYDITSGTVTSVSSGSFGTFAMSNIALAVWLVLGILLFCLTARLYRARHSEIAETTTSKGLLQVIIKLVGVIIAAICTGLMFEALGGFDQLSSFYLWAAIGGALAYAIIEVILNRGFKTLAKSLPLGALMLVVALGGCSFITTGGLGYENRVPAASSVESVTISYMGRYDEQILSLGEPVINPLGGGPIDAASQRGGRHGYRNYSVIREVRLAEQENIATVLAFHQTAVNEKFERNETEVLDATKRKGGSYVDAVITYQLRNGGSMSRLYRAVSVETLMLLAPLETNGEFIRQTSGVFYTAPALISKWTVADAFGRKSEDVVFSTADSGALLEAIKADLLAATPESLLNPTGPAFATVSYAAQLPNEGNRFAAEQGYFYITDETQQSYRFLQQKGLLDGLAPDLSGCLAVSIDPQLKNYRGQNAIRQITPSAEMFSLSSLEGIRENLAEAEQYRANNPNDPELYGIETAYSTKESAYRVALFETPAEIASLAKAVVPNVGVDERAVLANFYFEGMTDGSSVGIAIDRLPEPLKTKVLTLCGFYVPR